jgi:hypothetical protein
MSEAEIPTEAVSNKPPAYRTVGFVSFLSVILGALCYLLPKDEYSFKMFGTAAWAFSGFAAVVVLKRVGEAAATGNGLKGILNTLTTSAKPGEPPETK